MNEHEKSLKLADLMGWKIRDDCLSHRGYHLIETKSYNWLHHSYLSPYSDSEESLAQFAAILLKFPEVMIRFVDDATSGEGTFGKEYYGYDKPTQANILNEILVMNGVKI